MKEILINMPRFVPIFVGFFLVIKAFVVPSIEKEMEPYYIKVARVIVKEIAIMIYFLFIISFVEYRDMYWLGIPHKIILIILCGIVSAMTGYLLYQISLIEKINPTKKLFLRKISSINRRLLVGLQIILTISLAWVLNNYFLNVLNQFGLSCSKLLYLFFPLDNIAIGCKELLPLQVTVAFLYIMLYVFFRLILMSVIISELKMLFVKPELCVHMKSGDEYKNMVFINRNKDCIVVKESKCSKYLVLFKREILFLEFIYSSKSKSSDTKSAKLLKYNG